MNTQTSAVTDQGRRTRASIVEAAAELMYVNGVAATSLDKVLDACGAGKSQLYHYFTNKHQLVEAVIEYNLERTLGMQPLLTTLASWADFDEWAEGVLDPQRPPAGPRACPLGNLSGELRGDPDMAARLDKAYREWESHLERGLRRLRDKGELAEDADPARLAQVTMACLQGGLLLSSLRRDVTPFADVLYLAIANLKQHAT